MTLQSSLNERPRVMSRRCDLLRDAAKGTQFSSLALLPLTADPTTCEGSLTSPARTPLTAPSTMGPPRPRPSSPTSLFRQQILGQHSHQQQAPDVSPPALLMPLSATTGAVRPPPPPPLPPPAVGFNAGGPSSALYVPPARAGGRALRSRPADVDELGRKPGTVDLPGVPSASKRRRVEAPAPGPSQRRFIPPPPLPLPGEDPDEDAEPASEYSASFKTVRVATDTAG